MPRKINGQVNRQREDVETYRIIKAIGYEDILYPSRLNEDVDWNFIKLEGQKYAKQIAILVKEITKKGSRVLYNKMKMIIKNVYRYIQENKQPYNARTIRLGLKSLVWMLSFILLECGDNGVMRVNDYAEYQYNYNKNSLKVKDSETGKTYVVSEQNGRPVINEKAPEQFQGVEKMAKGKMSPIVKLKPGEKIPVYHASPEIKRAIAEAESFVDHIYDSANPRRKITPNDMKTGKDLTIGYGHKLTKKEKLTWKCNKKITKEEAYNLFLKDFGEHEQTALNALKTLPFYNKVKFSQGFIDGIISIRYNSSPELAFGRPDWWPKNHDTFWERLSNCRMDNKNGCIDYSDFVYTLPIVKKMYSPKKADMGGLPIRRQNEYNIMMQQYGKINPSLYNLKKKNDRQR